MAELTEDKIKDIMIAEFMGYSGEQLPIILHRLDFRNRWDHLIPVYNKCLKVVEENQYLNELLKQDENFLPCFALRSVFGLFENQLHISSAFVKITDFIKWYNKNKHYSGEYKPAKEVKKTKASLL